LAYLATRLGERLEKHFSRVAAVVVMLLALVSLDGGLNLLGSPLARSAVFNSIASVALAPFPSSQTTARPDSLGDMKGVQADSNNVMLINVNPNSYAPNRFQARAAQPAKLKLITNHTYG
jgi:hypothetical protein